MDISVQSSLNEELKSNRILKNTCQKIEFAEDSPINCLKNQMVEEKKIQIEEPNNGQFQAFDFDALEIETYEPKKSLQESFIDVKASPANITRNPQSTPSPISQTADSVKSTSFKPDYSQPKSFRIQVTQSNNQRTGPLGNESKSVKSSAVAENNSNSESRVFRTKKENQ